jgi:hypothetical protein
MKSIPNFGKEGRNPPLSKHASIPIAIKNGSGFGDFSSKKT